VLTEHLRTVGGAECTQIAGLRPVSASHNSTLTFPLLRRDTAMAKGRPKAPLVLSEAEQAQLSSIARSRSMPAALTERAQIVLRCASGQSNHAVAQHPTLTETTVGKWRGRPRDGDLQEQRTPLLGALWPQAPSHRELQALDGCVFHREAARCGGHRHRGIGGALVRAGARRARALCRRWNATFSDNTRHLRQQPADRERQFTDHDRGPAMSRVSITSLPDGLRG